MANVTKKLSFILYLFFKRFYLFIFRERVSEAERKGEKHQCVVVSHIPLTGDLACNPGMCPDWESNLCPFGSQAHAQSTELHQPGPNQFLTRGSSSRDKQVFSKVFLNEGWFFFPEPSEL